MLEGQLDSFPFHEHIDRLIETSCAGDLSGIHEKDLVGICDRIETMGMMMTRVVVAGRRRRISSSIFSVTGVDICRLPRRG